MGSWYDSGFGGISKEEQRLANMSGPNRVWMPPGTTREVIFLDSEPVAIYEHNAKINNSWKNWFTCLQGIEDTCPACEILGAQSRYYIGYFTVVDASKWTDKKGNDHQFELNLLPAKIKSFKKFRRKNQERIDAGGTGLAGCLYRLARDSSDDPSIGSEAEFVRETDLVKLFPLVLYKGKKLSELFDKAEASGDALTALKRLFQLEFDDQNKLLRQLVPFNYMEVLKPLPQKDMRLALQGAAAPGSDGAVADDKVPF